MWLQLGLVGGAIILTAAILSRYWRRRGSRNRIDVGPVSDAWLAEQRSRRHDGL